MATSGDLDSAIRVVVTPAQSSYFAGEPFSVTITFTNTRTPSLTPPTTRPSHRRGAHSISSAPLARPPTSPGTPRTIVTPIPSQTKSIPVRKGFIGKVREKEVNTPEGLPDIMAQRRRKLLGRSLSVDISPKELESQIIEVGETTVESPTSTATTPAFMDRFHDMRPPTTPQISPTLARSPSLPLSSSHPHFRKHSLLDGELQIQQEISQTTTSSQPSSPYPQTPSASNSAFSLVLDPISESSSPLRGLPPSPLIPRAPSTHSPPNYTSHSRRPHHLGLGHPIPQTQTPRTAYTSTSSQSMTTELILYSYAQLTGTLTIPPPLSSTSTSEQSRALNTLRSKLLKRSVVGGGSMDITSTLRGLGHTPSLFNHGHRRTASGGILSFLSPSISTPGLGSKAWVPSHRPRTASVFTAGVSTGAGLAEHEEIDPDIPLPTFEVPPSMLAVDLSLAPGESRSYTYTITLPDNLPPTYKGRSVNFGYELVVGTCRACAGGGPVKSGTGNTRPTGANSNSRVMKVPIRVYNHVSVGKIPRPYDLLWPVAKRIKPMAESVANVVEDVGRLEKAPVVVSVSPRSAPTGSFDELQEYAGRLVASIPEPPSEGGLNGKAVRIKLPPEAISPRSDLEGDDEGSLTGCREAVEILTRNPKTISYDVNKDGVKVAVLTFTKSAYRLGETVLGVVELNERLGQSRVLQLSAMLETQESLPSSISHGYPLKQMRRVHAEHHSSFVVSTLRTTFALDIPPDASPAFQINIGDNRIDGHRPTMSGGLEWRVRLCLLVAVAAESSDSGTHGVRMKHLERDGPKGEWGCSWKANRGIAPMERPVRETGARRPATSQSWTSFFASAFLGVNDAEVAEVETTEEGEFEEDYGGGEEGWREVRVETVECEVPIKVWPGNTAFKAIDVVFDV